MAPSDMITYKVCKCQPSLPRIRTIGACSYIYKPAIESHEVIDNAKIS